MLLYLPDEITVDILSYMRLRELISMSETCTYMRKMCHDEFIWKRLSKQIYGMYQKVHCHKLWYYNFTYIYTRHKFTPTQVQVLKEILNTSPNSVSFIQKIHKHNTYIYDTTPHEQSLTHVVISIRYNKCIPRKDMYDTFLSTCDGKYVSIGVLRRHSTYLWKILTGKHDINGKLQVKYIDNYMNKEDIKILTQCGSLVKDYGSINTSLIYITRQQLHSIFYILHNSN